MANTPESLADKLFPTLQEEEQADSILSIPPEQRRLHTETYDFTVSTILDYMKLKNIFVPEFQRRYVWTPAQASRLIESLIIQCPIPVIYLSQEKDERLSVIDGNQRLKSLERYMTNQFPLKGLTAYPELEGSRFHDLDARFQRHIINRTLRCIVIMKDTHPQVKFDVFERLNTGAVKLTAQELRHGLYHGSFMKLVLKLAKQSELHKLLDIKIDKRMKAEELIIRFFALHYRLNDYRKPLTGFINDYSEENREVTEEKTAELTALLKSTLDGVMAVYGDFAFKIFDQDFKQLSKFNSALFDAEMLSVSKSNFSIATLKKINRDNFKHAVANAFDNPEFFKSITLATSDDQQLHRRVAFMTTLLHQFA